MTVISSPAESLVSFQAQAADSLQAPRARPRCDLPDPAPRPHERGVRLQRLLVGAPARRDLVLVVGSPHRDRGRRHDPQRRQQADARRNPDSSHRGLAPLKTDPPVPDPDH